ncbi:MAG: exodeoxyribonuclease VII small subunit [Mycobacterium leprae]
MKQGTFFDDEANGAEAKESKVSFEEALTRLEQVVRQLENGELSLEQALALFQEGVALARTATKQLDDAEGRIEKLLEENGQVTVTPVEPK